MSVAETGDTGAGDTSDPGGAGDVDDAETAATGIPDAVTLGAICIGTCIVRWSAKMADPPSKARPNVAAAASASRRLPCRERTGRVELRIGPCYRAASTGRGRRRTNGGRDTLWGAVPVLPRIGPLRARPYPGASARAGGLAGPVLPDSAVTPTILLMRTDTAGE